MNKNKNLNNQKGFAHPELFLVVLVVAFVGFAGWRVLGKRKSNKPVNDHPSTVSSNSNTANNSNDNSTDALAKGKQLSNSECTGEGSKPLTHAPMAVSDLSSIQPMGLMVGGHVTPVDHEYYWGKGDGNSALDAYPVYADADGTITAVMTAPNGDHTNWWVTIAHSCTFLSNYNLMTSIDPSIKAKLPAGWGPNNNGGVKIPVKSGDLIGHVGHQSLDYQVWDTTKNLTGLLNPVAYNNAEPWKVNTVEPLNYFTKEVKDQILPKYMRQAKPLDGKIDYDQDGKAVGTWFLKGTNGYSGSGSPGQEGYWKGHMSLAYYYLDPSVLEFSTGDYQGQAQQFAITGNTPDWTTVTPASGVVKYQLAELNQVNSAGATWSGGFDKGVTAKAGTPKATLLLQMTDKQEMKVEIFPGKTPAEVTGFDSNAKTYNRGQDAKLVPSNTAH